MLMLNASLTPGIVTVIAIIGILPSLCLTSTQSKQ